MFRFLTIVLVSLFLLTSLVSSTPVPIPGRLSASETSQTKRTSALSASARALSNLGDKAAAKGKRVESTSEWIKREIDTIEAVVGKMERGLAELVGIKMERANLSSKKNKKRSNPKPKFAARSKDSSEAQEAALRKLSKSRRSTSTTTTKTAKRSAVPAKGLTASALGQCFYVGSDFLMHDCNEQVNPIKASLNSAQTPEQKKIFSSASAALAKATAAASA